MGTNTMTDDNYINIYRYRQLLENEINETGEYEEISEEEEEKLEKNIGIEYMIKGAYATGAKSDIEKATTEIKQTLKRIIREKNITNLEINVKSNNIPDGPEKRFSLSKEELTGLIETLNKDISDVKFY